MMRMFFASLVAVSALFFAIGFGGCDPNPPQEKAAEKSANDASTGEATPEKGAVDMAPDSGTKDEGMPAERMADTGTPTDEAKPKTIVGIASGNPDFSILVAALKKAELVSAVEANGLTVFAPTNAAFASLLKDDLGLTVDENDPLKDLSKEQLIPILKYHVIGAKVDAAAAKKAAEGNSEVDALGGKIKLSLDGDEIKLDGRATVTTADVMASNGIIHIIDKVILPSMVDVATTDKNFSLLAAALTKAGLVAAVQAKDLTVFAPDNAAFASLLKDDLGLTVDENDPLKDLSKEQLIPILKYHVIGAKVDAAAATKLASSNGTADALGGTIKLSLDGGKIKLDDRATVVAANLFTENGIIHVIDKVILPSITEVLAKSAKELQLEQLLAAVGAADNGKADADKLVTLLDGKGPFTVFAPMDSAFAKALTDNKLADLGALVTALGGQDALIGLLKYHVAAARLDSKAVVGANGKEVDVASGGKVSVTVENNSVILNKDVAAAVMGVNDATVKVVDIYTSNGVIHILDRVIAPKK